MRSATLLLNVQQRYLFNLHQSFPPNIDFIIIDGLTNSVTRIFTIQYTLY